MNSLLGDYNIGSILLLKIGLFIGVAQKENPALRYTNTIASHSNTGSPGP